MLEWQAPERLTEVKQGEVIIISHNRGTWQHRDTARNNCVIVTRRHDRFQQFGPDQFFIREIDAWARFNPPT